MKKALIPVGILILLESLGTILIPEVQKYFYNVLELKAVDQFVLAITFLVLVNFGLDIIMSFKRWVVLKFAFNTRQGKYLELKERWLKTKGNQFNFSTALTTALSISTENYITVTVEMIISGIIVAALIVQHSGNMLVLGLSLGYTVAVCAIGLLFNKALVSTDRNNQTAEGQHREALISHVNYEEDLSITIHSRWNDVALTAMKKFKVIGLFTLFTRFKGTIAGIIGYVLLSPKYFAGTITLGEFMGIVAVFQLIVMNTTYIVNLYPQYTQARASRDIIKEFENSL